MSDKNHYDVIIIGTGAGGGTLARKLAPTGKRVLLLERGDYVPREKDNWSTRAVNVQGKYQTKEVWRDRVTTVLPRQGQYANDAAVVASLPAADLTVERVGDLLSFDFAALVRKSS